MKNRTCCFAGHRNIPADRLEGTVKRLNHEIDSLLRQGVTDFISGGALGFDQIAASLIVMKKEAGRPVRLIFALPCKNQDELWSPGQKRLYRSLLAEADEVIYLSEEYTPDCIKKRNYYMIDRSAVCLCALAREESETGQAVRRARKQGLRIINVAEDN